MAFLQGPRILRGMHDINQLEDRRSQTAVDKICLVVLVLTSLLVIAMPLPIRAESVVVAVDAAHARTTIPPDFSGLSFEVALLLPGSAGQHYFRADNLPLINLFHTLGIRSLRLGGNTSDRDARQLPSEVDFDSLFSFAKAAGVKVIYCLRLHQGDPEQDARTARYILNHYAAQMDCFSIGQEPSAYPVAGLEAAPETEPSRTSRAKYSYETFGGEWKRFAEIVTAAAPAVRFCGPSVHNNGEWARRFINDFGRSNHVCLITEHLYPGGAGGRVPSPEIGQDRMLSNDFTRVYQKLYDSFVPLALSNGLPYRLEEVNNYFNGGAANVSNTFASALWGLDFMHWWAEHGAAGLNFHTGDRVAAGRNLQPSKYTAFFSTTNGFLIRPLAYGLQAFALGSQGRRVPVTVLTRDVQLSAYAVLQPDDALLVTLLNKEHGPGARTADVKFAGAGSRSITRVLWLANPEHDVAATAQVTLGGAEIRSDGTWNGQWTPVSKRHELEIPPATAALVKVEPVR